MIPPSRVLRIFGTVFLSGVGLGIYYGFLGSPRRKSPVPADLAFLAGLGWCLVLVAFPLCDGDLRPACLGVLILFSFNADKDLRMDNTYSTEVINIINPSGRIYSFSN